jgi:uncharacterized membrane protein YeaQ/YmgE (transglycosylase-associated protein family)
MIIDIIVWAVFGALAGWLASKIIGEREGCAMNIIIGVVGAFIGGFVVSFLTGTQFSMEPGFHPINFIVAVAGAVILLLIVRAFRRS